MRYHYIYIVFLFFTYISNIQGQKPQLDIATTRIWKPFATHAKSMQRFIGYNTITLTWRGTHPLHLSRFSLAWQPSNQSTSTSFDHLVPFLYKTTPRSATISHKKLIAKGVWNKKNQSLIFEFAHPHKLIGREELMLVLHTPQKNIPALEQGTFVYDDTTIMIAKEL